ncbi:LCP family protein [Actinacidiphila yeochonensis]|uniref:LCP family protein n=1 Tax=Actinacidiphila yeochonensis TaxID=89050 RepID=UPI000561D87F|nr:LCP family protein [Actinacidiphila yeochonensis]
MDTQGSGYVDPADQWVLDPATGTYVLRLDPGPDPSGQDVPRAGVPTQSEAPPTYRDHVGIASGPAAHRSRPDAASPGSTPDGTRDAVADRPAGGRAAARRQGGSGGGSRRDGAGTGRAGGSSRRKPKPKRSGALLWTAGVIGLAVVAGGTGGYLAFHRAGTIIHTVEVGDAGSTSLAAASTATNVLVVGTDSGAGLGHEFGSPAATGQADTAVLVHLAAGRGNATAISIPPDLVTDVPDCPVNGQVAKGTSGQPFSAVLAGRDAGCAMRLAKQLTGLPVDHVLEVDFAAVKTLTDAVGGVDVCLQQPLQDARAGLDLAAGTQRLQGTQALALVRSRQSTHGGDDLSRVAVQEQFLAGLLRAARSGGVLSDARKVASLASTAAGALTVDSPIGNVQALGTLAGQLGQVPPEHFTFVQLPVKAAGDGKGGVVLDQQLATPLLAMVKADTSLSRGVVKPDPKLVGAKATPHNTRVLVHNGTGEFGAAQDVLAWLQNDEGVDRSTNGGDAPSKVARTTLQYAPNQADQARSLAAMMGLPASALVEGTKDAAFHANMTLTLGADYTSPGTPIGAPVNPPKGLRSITGASTACVD